MKVKLKTSWVSILITFLKYSSVLFTKKLKKYVMSSRRSNCKFWKCHKCAENCLIKPNFMKKIDITESEWVIFMIFCGMWHSDLNCNKNTLGNIFRVLNRSRRLVKSWWILSHENFERSIFDEISSKSISVQGIKNTFSVFTQKTSQDDHNFN